MIPCWWRTPRRGTHDLAALGSQCKGIDNSLDLLIDRLDDLSQYAWAYRYPTSLAEPPAPEVDEASALAHMILAEVVKRLPPEVREQAGP
jgi:hypothetical protein